VGVEFSAFFIGGTLILVNERYLLRFLENQATEMVAAGEQPATLVRLFAPDTMDGCQPTASQCLFLAMSGRSTGRWSASALRPKTGIYPTGPRPNAETGTSLLA